MGAISALPKIIKTGFQAVHLIYFFTAGHDECKCWQIRKMSKAPQASLEQSIRREIDFVVSAQAFGVGTCRICRHIGREAVGW